MSDDGLSKKQAALVEEYVAGGMTYEQARAYIGMPVEGAEPAELSDELSDEELLELNGSLAIRAIHKALTSGRVDNTLVTAAVRAAQMLEDARKSSGGLSAEDDMLQWVAERHREDLEAKEMADG